MRKRKFIIMMSLCAVLMSSCSDGMAPDVSHQPAPTETAVASETGERTEAHETSEAAAESTSRNEETETSTGSSSEANTSETQAPQEESSDTGSVTETSETSRTSAPETSSATSLSVSSAAPETKAPAVTSKAAKPPAEIVIPKIKMPQAPGTDVISGDNSEIDLSNASEGYISAVYTGQSAAAKIRIQCGDVRYDHDLAVGGKREFFPLMGSGDYTVSVFEQFSGKKYAQTASGSFSVTLRSPTEMYLYPNKYVDFDSGSDCVRKAAELCAGLSGDVEKIAEIFIFITDNITYDKQLAASVKSGYVPDPDSTLASKKGICFDYASLFAAMCRSQGIPARLVIGYADPDIYHAWNEVYTDETGWITPELFLKNKGYNIADATFYASNSDKEKISDYISDDGNYSAVYRY